jgi:peptidoglycan/LPS O-acetylase OafA/YrhL
MNNKRNFGLDMLRAMAIAGVFLAHGVTMLWPLGLGVDLFFVLSGFLIGRIYFRWRTENRFHLGRFWVERWWRTLPPYLAALGLFALVERWIPSNPVDWHYLFFLQNFTGIKGFAPSWSLCVEEHFYLLLPLLALAAERIIGRKHFAWLLPLAFLAPTLMRAATIASVGGVANMPNEWYRMTPFHCDGLIAGVYLAFLFVERPEWFARAGRPAIVFAPLVVMSVILTRSLQGSFLFETLHSAVEALGFAGWLVLAYGVSWKPQSSIGRMAERTVRGAALASYSIYLLHVLVMTDLHVVLVNWHRGVGKTLFILSTTVVVCVVFYFVFERTSIRSRDRFLRRKDTAGHPLSQSSVTVLDAPQLSSAQAQ